MGEQMMRKKISFLDPEPHKGLYGHLARELVDESRKPLEPRVTIRDIEHLLQNADACEIPVVGRDNICIGFTTTTRLRAQVSTANAGGIPLESGTPDAAETMGVDNSRLVSGSYTSLTSVQNSAVLNVEAVVDRSPYKVDEDMPAQRVYNLFAKAGINLAIVVSTNGQYRGVITRTSLSKLATKLHTH